MSVSILSRHGADTASPTRFGFIVSKQVGIAVLRNRQRRRLKAIAAQVLPELGGGLDVVIRLHPESAAWGWSRLQSEVVRALRRALQKQQRARGSNSPAGLASGAHDARH